MKQQRAATRDQDVHLYRQPRPTWWPKAWGWQSWHVQARGFVAAQFLTQAPAAAWGRALAIELKCDLVVHGRDGKIRRKDSYGADSPKRKG